MESAAEIQRRQFPDAMPKECSDGCGKKFTAAGQIHYQAEGKRTLALCGGCNRKRQVSADAARALSSANAGQEPGVSAEPAGLDADVGHQPVDALPQLHDGGSEVLEGNVQGDAVSASLDDAPSGVPAGSSDGNPE